MQFKVLVPFVIIYFIEVFAIQVHEDASEVKTNKADDHKVPVEYHYSYSVHAEDTGDIKSHEETRKDDAVHGSYSLIDADGFKRIVDYTVNKQEGFVANVRREPTNIKIPARKFHASQLVRNSGASSSSTSPSKSADLKSKVYHVVYRSPVFNYQYSN